MISFNILFRYCYRVIGSFIYGDSSGYQETARRCDELKTMNLLNVGSCVSGGENDAQYGPSLMPGGYKETWSLIEDGDMQLICESYDSTAFDEWNKSGRIKTYR